MLKVEKSEKEMLFDVTFNDGEEKVTHEIDAYQAVSTLVNFINRKLQEEYEENKEE